jgi:hypothetical protein
LFTLVQDTNGSKEALDESLSDWDDWDSEEDQGSTHSVLIPISRALPAKLCPLASAVDSAGTLVPELGTFLKSLGYSYQGGSDRRACINMCEPVPYHGVENQVGKVLNLSIMQFQWIGAFSPAAAISRTAHSWLRSYRRQSSSP